MRFKASKKTMPEPNQARLKLRFAIFPVRIGEQVVWLETYQQLQIFEVIQRKAMIDGKLCTFDNGTWVNTAKKCN